MKAKMALALMSLGFVGMTAAAHTSTIPSPAARVRGLMKQRVSADLKTVVTKTKEGICGAEGPSFIAEIQVKKILKSYNEKTGNIDLTDSWVTVKTYGIPADELLNSEKPQMMDSEACIE